MPIEDTLAAGMESREREHRAKQLLEEMGSSAEGEVRATSSGFTVYMQPDAAGLERATALVLQGWSMALTDASLSVGRISWLDRLFKPDRCHLLESSYDRAATQYKILGESLSALAAGPVGIEGCLVHPAVRAVEVSLSENLGDIGPSRTQVFTISACVDEMLPSYSLAKRLAERADKEGFRVRITKSSWPGSNTVQWEASRYASSRGAWTGQGLEPFYVTAAVKD
ncbi:MAG TPA: hypothetical protein VJB16_03535 [archaeon]|nr:hypothetical protein [archaeon]